MSNKYQKIITSGPSLCIAFQDHLTALSLLFSSVGLIDDDNIAEVTNKSISAPDRAAQLLRFIRTKVKLGDDNYDAFVEVLQRDQSAHCKQILEIRESCNEFNHNIINIGSFTVISIKFINKFNIMFQIKLIYCHKYVW